MNAQITLPLAMLPAYKLYRDMKLMLLLSGALALVLLAGCANSANTSDESPSEGTEQQGVQTMSSPAHMGSSEDATQSENKNINVAEFNKRRSASSDVVILDVRTPEEIADGKIPGALEIDYNASDFETQLGKLDRSKEYLVYCAAGFRSGKTTSMMAEMGFEQVYNLEGGYTAWVAAGEEQQ
jgi:rhodanese-related sulfurtransferase